MTDVSKIMPVIFLFIFSFLATLEPTMDNDFTFPVLIGIPKNEHKAKVKNEPRSEEKALCRSFPDAVLESDLIILPPPSSVESDITAAMIKISGNDVKFSWLVPNPKMKISTPKNFCPSCAPCINDKREEEATSSFLYGSLNFCVILVIKNEIKNEMTQEKIKYKTIKAISLKKPLFLTPVAKREPLKEKIKAWLSLDGRPKNQAMTPNRTIVIKQERQTVKPWLLLPKSVRENMVFATLAPRIDDNNTPKKLNIPESKAPCHSFNTPESTTEKIEFGASVQPLTKTTSRAKKKVKKPRGVSMFDQKLIKITPFTKQFFFHKIYL